MPAVIRIFGEDAAEFESHYSEESLAEYAGTHLGCAEYTIDEYYGDLSYPEAVLVCQIFHLDLECVTFETYLVERERA